MSCMLRVIDNVARTCSPVPLTDKSNDIIRKVLYVKKQMKLMITRIFILAQFRLLTFFKFVFYLPLLN